MTADDFFTLITVLGLAGMGLLICAAFIGIIMSSRTLKYFPFLQGRVFPWHMWSTIVIGSCLLLHSLFSLSVSARTKITWTNIVVPFTSTKETIWLGLGSLSLYAIVITIVLSLTVRRKSHRLWRLTHYVTYIVLVLGLIHGLFISSTFQPGWKLDYFDAEKVTVEFFGLLLIAAIIYRIRLTSRRSSARAKRAAELQR